MNYTDERMIPEWSGAETLWEHIYRYRFACAYVSGRRVLDIACGEGYGAAALDKAGASSVLGIDVSPDAVGHATAKYGLNARVGDAQQLPLGDGSIDLITSFETIEHLENPGLFLDECARVLGKGGEIIISTPNRATYQKDTPNNPYHLHEVDEEEFVALMKARFNDVQLFTQRPTSAKWSSLRILASDRSGLQDFRLFRLFRKVLRRVVCSEIVSAKSLDAVRQDPITWILKNPSSMDGLANPFFIRKKSESSGEVPMYLIAVAKSARQ